MNLVFTKMEGIGNDFVVVDAVSRRVRLRPDQIRHIADRHFGVGCDQLLIVEPPHSPNTDFCYRIFNADGGEVEQCGNGARCFARFVVDKGLIAKSLIAVETKAGIIELRIEADGQVTVNMGRPRFQPESIPFLAEQCEKQYTLVVDQQTVEIGAVSMGNPHAVLRVGSVGAAAVDTLGPALSRHPRFPRGVNVGFMEVVGETQIRLRVFERGVGETLACGTGACAAVAVGRSLGWLGEQVAVDLPGGRLSVGWKGGRAPVWMTGPATRVFEGRIEL